MSMDEFGSVEMQMLWWSIVLGIASLTLVTLLSVLQRGLPWGVGPRDEPVAPLGKIAARIERAFKNFLETFAFFVAVVLMAQALGKHSPTSALGAQLYFWGRLAFLPVYALGIPVLRTILWGVSLAGILMILLTVWPGT